MIGYFTYTGAIGIANVAFVEVRIEEALQYTISPFYRALLETARGFASISLFIGLLTTVRNWIDFCNIVKIFVWSGAISGSYGVYQAAILAFDLPFSLLPETLFHEGSARGGPAQGGRWP